MPPTDVLLDPAAMSWCDRCETSSRVVVDVKHDGEIVATVEGCLTCRTGIYTDAVPERIIVDSSRAKAGWTARLAPFAVVSDDARVFDPPTRPDAWTLPQLAPLVLLSNREVLGWVQTVRVEDDALLAAGQIYDPEGIPDGLYPQVEIRRAHTLRADEVEHFLSGEIGAVVLGDRPVWPDLWFRIDE